MQQFGHRVSAVRLVPRGGLCQKCRVRGVAACASLEDDELERLGAIAAGKTYDLGATSYITKPVTFDSMVDVVKTLGRYWLEIVELADE